MPILPPLRTSAHEDPPSDCCDGDLRQHAADCTLAPLDQLGGER